MSKYLSNAFSIQMLADGGDIRITPSNLFGGDNKYHLGGILVQWDNEAHEPERFRSGVRLSRFDALSLGHQGVVDYINSRITDGDKLSVCRAEIKLQPGDTLFVVQPVGKRLDVGTELGSDAEYQVYRVEVNPEPRLTDAQRLREAAKLSPFAIGRLSYLAEEDNPAEFRRGGESMCE